MHRLLLLISFILFQNFIFSQQGEIDSLLTLIKTDKEDTTKIKHLNKVCKEYITYGEFDSALNYTGKALLLAKTINFKKGMADSYNSIGVINANQGNYPEALKNYKIALKLRTEIKDKKGIASTFNNIGVIYDYQGNYPEALTNYFASLKIREEINDKKGIAISFMNIGSIYDLQGNFTEALKNHLASLKIRKEIGDILGVADSYNNLGVIYVRHNNYPEALKNYFTALKMYEEIGNKKGIANTYNNIGIIYSNQGNYLDALKMYTTSIKIREEIGDKEGEAASLQTLGDVYINLNKNEEAHNCLKKALQLSLEINNKERINQTYASYTVLDSAMGNFKAAFEHHKLYIIYRDSLNNEETQKKSMQANLQYEFDKKEIGAKAEQEKKDVVIAKEKQKQNVITYAIIGILLLVAVFAGFIYNRFRITQKQKYIIEHQKHLVEEKHKEITDSINYAERIQRSFLATKELLDDHLKDYFVLFQPKDVVSGDFYWAGNLSNSQFALATADSTGHGVPGAIMSLLNITSLESAIKDGHTAPADILNATRKTIIERLKKDGSTEGGKDGMDASLICFDFKNNQFTYAAANNPVWIARENSLIELAPNKMPIGKHDMQDVSFTQQEIKLQRGDVVYALTDGFPDQFGGPKGKKYMYKKLKELLISISSEPMELQKQKLNNALNNWKGDLEQVDDVTLIGIRI